MNNQITPLANFGTIKFTGSYAKIGDTVGTIASFPYSQVIMTNDLSLQLASVSPLGADGALRHRVSPDGFYRGKQVVVQPEFDAEDEE